MKYKIFVIWQSQNKCINKFIRNQLTKAQKKLKEKNIELELLFSPTQESTGSPNINTSIKENIRNADLVVADLSRIAELDTLHISNPNVMYEIGMTDILLGEERLILLCDENTDIEKLAFDINHQRISKFSIQDENFYKQLSKWIYSGLIDAEKNNFVRRYFINNIMSDLEIIINYFFDYAYSSGFANIENENLQLNENEIVNNFINGTYGKLKVSANLTFFVDSFESKLYKLNNYGEVIVFNQLICLVQLIREYIFLFDKNNPFYEIKNLTFKYNLLSNNSFFLRSSENYDEVMNSSYFRNDIIVVNRKDDGNIYLLTRDMIYNVLENEKLHHIEIDQNLGMGYGMTIYTDNVYGINEINIHDHVDIIIKILKKTLEICGNLNINIDIKNGSINLKRKMIEKNI